ncbi:MAG TPA: serine/threonine-protein kinase [Solirubrobacterales bacterium]|jgi:serine/threonine protein kinase
MPADRVWSELAEGDEFAGYRIERRLGRGGMGILYLALEPGLERRVALKLIAPEAAEEEVFARRFAEESRIAASIEHPNVVPIYAAGEQDGLAWIAMRYVAGSDLGRRIARDGRLEPAHAVALIAQVGNGLDAIHAAGLVHRDVKPANVLLSGEEGAEHAYITDFGVARNLATRSGLTQTGRFVGTIDYVAPEQIAGGEIDARVDVYALGCLLYKLLTGQVPFPREGEAARLYAHLNDPPPNPSLFAPVVPMALDDVVVRAMSKEPGDRYPSAGDLGRAAEAALRGGAVTVPERAVATGAAATVETPTPTPSPPPAAEPETAPTAPPSPTGPIRRDAERGPNRRRLYLGGAVLALIAAVVVGIVLATGGDSGSHSTDGTTSGVQPPGEAQAAANQQQAESQRKQQQQKPKPKPQALSRSQLIAEGDAVCEKSQAKYLADKESIPGGEEEASVPYSQLLVGISKNAVSEFRDLEPPSELRSPYRAYVKAQEEVAGWDRDALNAAKEGDTTAYLEARATRDETAEERKQLAEAVGFHVCSGSEA